VFWCLILNSFSIFVSERCQTKKFAVVGNGSDGCMWRRNSFWRRRRCARVRQDGFVKRILGTALWPRLLLKALVGFCFPGAGWCTYVRGSAFWDFGGRWGRICGPPRVEIRQFAFLEEVWQSRCITFIFGGSLTSFTPGPFFLACKQKALFILRSYTRFHGSWRETGYDWVRFRSVHVPDKLITQWMLRWGWVGQC